MLEASETIIDFAFSELNFRIIFAHTHESNLPSRKLLDKLRFNLKGDGDNR